MRVNFITAKKFIFFSHDENDKLRASEADPVSSNEQFEMVEPLIHLLKFDN